MNETVERAVDLEASLQEVWASLTEPERLSVWLGGEVDLDVRPGGRGMVRRADGAVRRMLVEAVDPPSRLAIRWWPFEVPGRLGPPGSGSRVEFVVESRENGTRLRVVERVPERLDAWSTGEPPDAPRFVSPIDGPSPSLRAVAR